MRRRARRATLPELARRRAPLSFLSNALFEPRYPARAIFVGWLLSISGSLILSAVIHILAPDLATPQFPDWPPAVLMFMLVVFAPVVETLIMAAMLEVLLRLRVPAPVAILLSTAGWAFAHSLKAAAWGLAIWWPFLIFSTLYVTWRERSVAAAIAVPMAAHALQNLLPALVIAFAAKA